eukprot:TRINITY_DN38210_c0_g1_i1.p1 TRINITY_DN38210_c0_g1~~TRINITY_DN38210_c0_g1_i1.p1  ORF type:complete len:579 (+),score=76.33 TRINITY_DN38210_c0_g1_i1:27-1739(+)
MAADGAEFEFAIKVAQIFSAVSFTLVAIWLTFSNSTSLGYVQRASLEKRLTVCCFINTYIGLFSAFFNFFQLTKVDDSIMPEHSNYTIDLARPIEWICTCPLMQLILVILGGSKLPDYRRRLMPFLSVSVLGLGLLSTYIPGWPRFIPYAMGCATAGLMFFLNAKQITERSDGVETLLSGDSEYRKATLLVVVLWFPFPFWYILSPEGANVISDALLIQVGWAFLNIVAKFSFIFYIQRMKDLYCARLKAKREMNKQSGACRELEGELTAVIVETLNLLGMAHNSGRVQNLFAKAGIVATKDIEQLSYQECKEKHLPCDIVHAIQDRLRVWRLESRDTAEADLEQGEFHYFKGGFKGVVDVSIGDDSTSVGDSLPGFPSHVENDSNSSQHWTSGATRVQRRSNTYNQDVAQLSVYSKAIYENLETLSVRLAGLEAGHGQSISDQGSILLSKIEMLVDASTHRIERNLHKLSGQVRDDIQTVGKQTTSIGDEANEGSNRQQTSLSYIRRQHMMLMELVSSDRENMQNNLSNLGTALQVKVPDAAVFAETIRDELQTSLGLGSTWKSSRSID